VGMSLSCSYAVEVLQLFLPGRVSSLKDILSNGAGGALGFVCYSMWRHANTGLVVPAYLVMAGLASIPLQWSTTIRNWNTDFPLMLGNERTGDRPWRGRVFDVSILDRAISEREIAQLYHNGKTSSRVADALVASYRLDGRDAYRDTSGHLPPLVWRTINTADGNNREVGLHHWLETTGPATPLIERLKQTSAFTLIVTAKAADTRQAGPARIVSLSGDIFRRNFTLGQSGHDLAFRLRTQLTGENGFSPEFIVPGVFSTYAERHLVITYDGLDVLAYIDGTRSAQRMRLGLGAAAFAPVFGRNPSTFYTFNILYYAIVFLPAGMLIALTETMPRGRRVRIAVLASSIVAFSLGFEAILIAASGRPFNSSNVVWGTVFAAAGVVTYQLIRSAMFYKRNVTEYTLRLSKTRGEESFS
jgi:glycopeptide antibiotics resistance protein